jgi:hypothetical protein
MEQDVKDWFQKYHDILREYKIIKGKNILNIDELGARVGCPGGEHVIIPSKVKELYIASPKNRKLVMVIKIIIVDRREPLPPFIIALGKKIIDNWISKKLIRKERIAATPIGYINNQIAL